MSRQSPSFDLVVATMGRSSELSRFLSSVESQAQPRLRVIVVDQNSDDRVESVLARHDLTIRHVRSAPPGLSRARNVGLELVAADVVAFPDDDCVYPAGLLRRVGERLAASPELDGLTGRAVASDGTVSASWRSDAATLRREDVWNRAISFTIFLRQPTVEAIGTFDEQLGLGSGRLWHSGEEIDYLIRALDGGARIEYDPTLVVEHDVRPDTPAVGLRDGASVGYLLRKHAYSSGMVGRLLVRPVVGALVAATRRDTIGVRYQLGTLQGRVRGYLGAKRAKISA